ncbi:MAG: TonB-dependent receptor [Pseudomonadota bacterium]|jgi:vitamin B12 transporter
MSPDLPPPVQEVVVAGARLADPAGAPAFSLAQIGEQALQSATRLDAALGSEAGVSLFRRTSSLAANPTTQGLALRAVAPSGAGRALVTLDGAPQNDPFGGWVIWSSLPDVDIERASIVRGAGAGPYGAGALTGVVALDEKSSDTEVLTAEGASRGQQRAALAGETTSPLGKLFLAASGEHSEGWIPVKTGRGAADALLTLSDWSLASRLDSQLGKVRLSTRIDAYREARGSGLVGANSAASGQDVSLALAQPDACCGGWRVQAWGRTSNLQNSSVSVPPGRKIDTPANTQFKTPADGYGLNAAWRGAWAQLSLETGLDLRRAEGRSEENFRYQGAGFTRLRVAGGASSVGGAYVESAWSPGPWLVALGLRADRWDTYRGHRRESDIASGATTLDLRPADRGGVAASARLGVKRTLAGGLYWRAAAYSGFRPPTLNELYRPFRVGNDVTEANAALKPEVLTGAEAGLGVARGRFSLDATLFANRVRDPVTNVTLGLGPATFPVAGFIPAGGTYYQRRNIGRIDAVGAELDAKAQWTAAIASRLSLDYTDARVDGQSAAPRLTGKRPAESPRWTVTAGADARLAPRLRLALDLRYESVRYDDDLNTRRLAPAVVLNARLEQEIAKTATAYIGVDNLTSSHVETARSADGTVSLDAPLTVRAGLRLRL